MRAATATAAELKRAGVRPTEAQVLRAIREYLDARKIFYLRLNSGAQIVAGAGGERRAIRLAPAGTADLVAFVPWARCEGCYAALPADRMGNSPCCGRSVDYGCAPLFIEAKAPGGVLSPAQLQFLAARRRAGIEAIVAFSVEDVETKLSEMAPEDGGSGL